MKHIFKYTITSVAMAFAMSSCDDYFNVLPKDEVVLENFYTEEADLMSVLYSCYSALESPECIKRMAVWGEFRSENLTVSTSSPTEITQLMDENILPTFSFSKWSDFYVVINRCNTVIHYAPIVNERDPNFTISEMRAAIAEAKAIRALSYFYLIRAFRDVPLVTEPSIDDTKSFEVPAASFDSILNFLVQDLEPVKNHAVRKFAIKDYNVTRFTRYAIYALLAELHLWNKEYEEAIENCDLVINQKIQLYEEELRIQGSNIDLDLYKGVPLYSEHATGRPTQSGNSSTKIFGTQRSFESIFELSFISNRSDENTFIYDYYSKSGSGPSNVSVTPFLYENAYMPTGNEVFKNTDCRYIASIHKIDPEYSVAKYTRVSNYFNNPTKTMTDAPTVSFSGRTNKYSNWIIYRLSDILLIKAEASLMIDKSSPAQQLEAFKWVTTTYNRANNMLDTPSDTLVFSNYTDGDGHAMENLILLERQREFLFEGKRWFDLVRYARLKGNNDIIVMHAIKKQKSNTAAIKVKLSSIDATYFPYAESELEVNSKLKQNPAYIVDKTVSLSE